MSADPEFTPYLPPEEHVFSLVHHTIVNVVVMVTVTAVEGVTVCVLTLKGRYRILPFL